MFADIALAKRIEQNTARLLAESAAATAQRRADADVFVHPIAGGVAAYTGPGSPLNKVAGLGFTGVPDERSLAEIEHRYFSRGVTVQCEVATLGDPRVGEMLTRRGYVLIAHENVLAMRISAQKVGPPGEPGLRKLDEFRASCESIESRSTPHSDQVLRSDSPHDNHVSNRADEIRISLCPETDFQDWLDVVVTGFASPDEQGLQSHESFGREVMEQVVADMCSAAGFARYIAHRNGERAGGASVYISEGIAQLCGAATLPAHRRRGVQSALFETRLRDAAAAGCDLATITTLPGSKSQENAQRRGFALLYSRAILVRQATN